MRVVAIAAGDVGGVVRFPGDEFDMPEGATGSWFRPIGSSAAPAPPPAGGSAAPVSQPAGGKPRGRPRMTDAQKAEVAAERARARIGVGTGEGHDMT